MDFFTSIKHDALNDEAVFNTYEHDYEIVTKHHGQIMRMLRNLPAARKGEQIAIDAITTALSIIERELDSAIEIDATNAEASKAEMACYGGEE